MWHPVRSHKDLSPWSLITEGPLDKKALAHVPFHSLTLNLNTELLPNSLHACKHLLFKLFSNLDLQHGWSISCFKSETKKSLAVSYILYKKIDVLTSYFLEVQHTFSLFYFGANTQQLSQLNLEKDLYWLTIHLPLLIALLHPSPPSYPPKFNMENNLSQLIH